MPANASVKAGLMAESGCIGGSAANAPTFTNAIFAFVPLFRKLFRRFFVLRFLSVELGHDRPRRLHRTHPLPRNRPYFLLLIENLFLLSIMKL